MMNDKEILYRLQQCGGIKQNGTSRWRLLDFLKKTDVALLQIIIQRTSFLPTYSPLKERLFCIKNHIKTQVMCLRCSNFVKFTTRGTYSTFCSTKCSSSYPKTKEKTKQTNLKRYGVIHPHQLKEKQEKIKQTNIDRYGVEHPLQNKMIQEKQKQTNLERYGVEWTTQVDEVKEKTKQTFLKNYGVDNPNKCKEVREKTKQTNLERYGVIHPQQNKEVRKKTKQTNLERYGSSCSIGLRQHEFNEKRKITSFNKYGVKYSSQKHNPHAFELLSDYTWLYDQYITQEKTTETIGKELKVDPWTVCNYLHNQDVIIRRIQHFSSVAIQWLDRTASTENIFIQHARNVGEYQIPNTRYSADGYCEETNTIYEFHGDMWHGNPKIYNSREYCHPFDPYITAGDLYQKTINREQFIISSGYNLVIMWESDWNTKK